MRWFRGLVLSACVASGVLGARLRRAGQVVAESLFDRVTTGADNEHRARAEAGAALWAGSDDVPQWHLDSLTARANAGGMVRTRSSRMHISAVQIVGMYDSGTNLMGATLKLNIPDFELMCPGAPGCGNGFHCHWWKHADPAFNEHHLDDRTLLIQMVRSPLAQIAAWGKAGYKLTVCGCSRNYSASCTIEEQTFPDGVTIKEKSYPGGVTDVWNQYTHGGDRIAARRENAIVVEYERLVLDPEGVVTHIAELLGVELLGPVQPVGAPAKLHGHPVGRQAALSKIKNMSYLQDPRVEAVRTRRRLCDELSDSTMAAHEVPVGDARVYAADCAQ